MAEHAPSMIASIVFGWVCAHSEHRWRCVWAGGVYMGFASGTMPASTYSINCSGVSSNSSSSVNSRRQLVSALVDICVVLIHTF